MERSLNKYCLALDLKDDPVLISKYRQHHQQVWPEVEKSIRDAGIIHCAIYLAGNRLFMILETTADFSFDKKSAMDAANPKVLAWEEMMWQYQQALPVARPGDKWILMEKIYEL